MKKKIFLVAFIIFAAFIVGTFVALDDTQAREYGNEKIKMTALSRLKDISDDDRKELKMLHDGYKDGTTISFEINRKMLYKDEYTSLFDFYLRDIYIELFPDLNIDDLENGELNYNILPSITPYISDSGKYISKVRVDLTNENIINYNTHVKIDEWISETFNKKMSKYDSLKTLGRFLESNCIYDKELNLNSYTMYGLFNDGKAVCQGYSIFYRYVCKSLGIECYYVGGQARNEGHAWNRVVLNGKSFYTDSSWAYDGIVFNKVYSLSPKLWSNRTIEYEI